ncbi:hypothetical protein AKJ16_DCAP04354 [Drosera capensis]
MIHTSMSSSLSLSLSLSDYIDGGDFPFCPSLDDQRPAGPAAGDLETQAHCLGNPVAFPASPRRRSRRWCGGLGGSDVELLRARQQAHHVIRRFIRDFAYDNLANNRYAIFGLSESCEI